MLFVVVSMVMLIEVYFVLELISIFYLDGDVVDFIYVDALNLLMMNGYWCWYEVDFVVEDQVVVEFI